MHKNTAYIHNNSHTTKNHPQKAPKNPQKTLDNKYICINMHINIINLYIYSMTIEKTKHGYRCHDHNGSWYPTAPTMIGAIQNALSIVCYYKNIKQ